MPNHPRDIGVQEQGSLSKDGVIMWSPYSKGMETVAGRPRSSISRPTTGKRRFFAQQMVGGGFFGFFIVGV